MKKVLIKEIKEKDQVAGCFLVTKKELGISKSGKTYLNLKLMDSTGELDARVWEDAEEMAKGFQKNDVVSVKGFAVAYQGGLQLNITSIAQVAEGGYSIRDFLPSSEKDPEQMIGDLDRIIDGIKDIHIKSLLRAVFSEAEIRERFKTAPAAKSMHHPYLGGLLEHVLSICGLAEKVSAHYGNAVNSDLLTAGAILHDIGKIYELSYKRSFDYTDEGRLLGHITIGVEIIDRKIREVAGFPKELSVLLKHMLLSHHGHLEFGSPKRPKTIEAVILSYLDDLDAKVSAIKSLMDGQERDAPWTPYQKLFERYIYLGTEEKKPLEAAGESKDDKGPGNLSLFKS